MTYPITPNPGIHIDPTAAVAQKAAVQNELKALEGLFSQLPGQILNAIVNSILKSLGWGNTSSTTPGGMAGEVEQALTQLYAQASTAATNLSALITNAEGQTIADLIAWLNNAQAAWTQLEAFLSTGDWADLTAAWNDLLQGLFGSPSSPGILGSIPSTAVSNITQNVQPVWDFPDAASVAAGGQWSWDGTVDHTGSTGSGSAKCVANGQSNPLIGVLAPVQPGQTVTPQGFVKWSGLTATGSPIELQLIPWSGTSTPGTAGTAVTPTGCAITSPGAASTSYSGQVAGWVELTGTYTVPGSGVGFVQLQPIITTAATAGSVWFDDVTNDVTGGFLANLQDDITTLESNSTASTAAFATFLQAIETAVAGYTNWSTFITACQTAWNTYSTTESGLVSSDIFTLQNFFNSLLGVNTSTGQIANTNISNSLGNSSLGADVQAILDYIANALGHSGTGHTLTQIETYLGLIPPANVTNVLGGANLGADVTSTHTTAVNGSTWSTRLTNDLLVLSDVFHLTYAAGTSTDPPGTLSGGKPTWYSCWNDLLALTGIVNSTTAPTDTAPTTGASITAAQASATTAGTNASIAISSASAANTLAQGTIDGLNTAWSAGGTGNPVTTIPTIAAAIPASAVVGGTGATVTFGAVGGGNAVNGSTSTLSTSWSHTIATGDLGVLVGISYSANSSSTWSSSATYGGTSMTLLKSQATGSAVVGTNGYTDVYWLKSPASGSQTVSVSVTRVSGSGIVNGLYGDSMSYVASKVGTVGGNTGGGSTSLSMSAASTTNHMVVGFFSSYVNNNNTLSSFNQTSRYSHNYTTVGLAAQYGDAAGASSVSFTATSAYSTQQWCGVTVELEN